MATVKKANVPPTHPTVYAGLALASIGLLLAMYAYTGSRVYDITFAFIAVGGGFLALVGIFTAAWGRSIMASRASRSRRAAISKDALVLGKPVPVEDRGSESVPTIAAPSEKKRFSFALPKRAAKKAEKPEASSVFAFKRRAPEPAPEPARDDPRNPAVAATLEAEPAPPPLPDEPVRMTLKCPQCATQFTAEGVRPFEARCSACGFSSVV